MSQKVCLASEELSVSINHKGLELSSVLDLKTGHEYIWQGAPDVWSSQAPVLFPNIGCLKNSEAHFGDQTLRLPKHGLIRHRENIAVEQHSKEAISFQFNSSDDTLKVFPFDFKAEISFAVKGRTLEQKIRVSNPSEKETLPFCYGGHPAFSCPQGDDEKYQLAFEQLEDATSLNVTEEGFIGKEKSNPFTAPGVIDIHPNLFDNDALVFTEHQSRKVHLKKGTNKYITVSFSDFPFLGIWAKPNAAFVCIEPWHGLSDMENTDGDFSKKPGLIQLNPGEFKELSFWMEFHSV